MARDDRCTHVRRVAASQISTGRIHWDVVVEAAGAHKAGHLDLDSMCCGDLEIMGCNLLGHRVWSSCDCRSRVTLDGIPGKKPV